MKPVLWGSRSQGDVGLFQDALLAGYSTVGPVQVDNLVGLARASSRSWKTCSGRLQLVMLNLPGPA